jgi:hypothetical protein
MIVSRGLLRKVRRLEARLEDLYPPGPHLYLACVGQQGRVLDDQTEAARPWVGRHFRELPDPVQVIRGVDPLEVFGLTRGEQG